jgi:spermidine synthase
MGSSDASRNWLERAALVPIAWHPAKAVSVFRRQAATPMVLVLGSGTGALALSTLRYRCVALAGMVPVRPGGGLMYCVTFL